MGFLKKFSGRLFQYGGSEGPEYFPVLDAPIQDFFHFRAAGIGQNAALPQGPRAPFRTALKPAQNFPFGNMTRGGLHQGILVELIDLDSIASALIFFDGAANVLGRGLRSPSGVVHHEFARKAENLMTHGKRGTDRKPGVAGGRLDVDSLKWRVIENFPVGYAVEGDPAGEA